VSYDGNGLEVHQLFPKTGEGCEVKCLREEVTQVLSGVHVHYLLQSEHYFDRTFFFCGFCKRLSGRSWDGGTDLLYVYDVPVQHCLGGISFTTCHRRRRVQPRKGHRGEDHGGSTGDTRGASSCLKPARGRDVARPDSRCDDLTRLLPGDRRHEGGQPRPKTGGSAHGRWLRSHTHRHRRSLASNHRHQIQVRPRHSARPKHATEVAPARFWARFPSHWFHGKFRNLDGCAVPHRSIRG
jgi:hypothetical protein